MFYIVVNRETHIVLASETVEPPAGAYPADIYEIIASEVDVLLDSEYNPDLEERRAIALKSLNTWRGEKRAGLGLTSATFQELVYTGKVLECIRWRAAPGSDFGLGGEAASRGITNEAMAEIVEQSHAQWQAASDSIEAAYFAVLPQIESAATIEEIAAVLAGLSWE